MIRHDYLGALCAGAFPQAGMLAAPAAAQISEDQSAVIEEIVVVGTAIRGTPIDEPYAVSVVDREELEQQGSPLMVDLFKNLGASNGVVGERSGWYNSSLPSAIWGAAVGESNLVVSVEHERRGELESEDRDWALRPLQDPWRASWSSVGNPGYFWFPEGIDTSTTPREEVIDALKGVQWSGKVDPQCNGLNGYPEHPAVDPYYCVFNYQPWDNLIEETRSTRALVELNGPWGNQGSYHLEALWSEAVMPKWQTQPSHPPFPLLHHGVMEVGPDHPNRVAFCQDAEYSGGFEAECAGTENWYWRGRPFGNGDDSRTWRRDASTWRLAGSIEGEFDGLGGREMYYDAGLSYSRGEGKVGIPAILTERLFLTFRGYGGPDCGVSVVADNTLGPGMRVGATTKAPGTQGCQYLNPFSSSSQYSSLPGAPYYDTPNPEYDPAQANSPELAQWLNSVSEINSETEMLVADLTFSGNWIDDFLGYAAGYQFRRFGAQGTPNRDADLSINPCAVLGDTNCLSGNFGGFTFINAYNPYDVDQTVHRVFAELAINLSDRFDAQAAVNYENYDEASSVGPKLALRWRVNDTLTLRGSVQSTFRTPSVDDLLEAVPLTVTQYISQVGAWIPVDIYGDSNLDPEQALTYNIGVVLFLDTGIQMTVDYWNYDFKDVIGSLPHDTVDDIYADASTREGVRQYIYCADGRADTLSNECGAKSITRVEVPLVNWPGVETSGIDWEFRGEFDAAGGSLAGRLSGTYTLDYDIKALSQDGVPIQAVTQAAGRLNFGNPLAVPIPNWKAQAFVAYHWNDYSLASYVNHVSSYKDDGAHDGYGGVPVDSFTVDSFTTWDLSLQWRLPNQGLNLTLAALNLTDEEPPFANVEHAYDGMTHNPKGRRLKLILRYRPRGE